MAKKIQVDTDLVDSAAKKIESLAGEYKATYAELYKKAQSMDAHWQGKDYEAFYEKIVAYKNALDKMHTLMINFSEHLKKASAAYIKEVETNKSEAAKLPTA